MHLFKYYQIKTIAELDHLDVFFNATRPVSLDIQIIIFNVVMPILGAVIAIVNLAIVISSGLILRGGQKPRSTYLFLGNVALSDMLVGLAVLFGHVYPSSLRGEITCAVQVGLIVCSAIVSVYSIGLIAIDRFLYIIYGLQYQQYIYPNRARIMIIFSWLLGFIIGFLPAMGIRENTDNGRLCWFIIITPPDLIIATIVIGILPLTVVVILYSIILHHALKKITQLRNATQNREGLRAGNLRLFRGGRLKHDKNIDLTLESQNLNPSIIENMNTVSQKVYNPSKWKAIKVVLYTTGCFFLTWFPFFVACALYVRCDPNIQTFVCDGLRVAITSPLALLGILNSLLNPLIYAWWHNGFRESFLKIIQPLLNTCNFRKPKCDRSQVTNSSGPSTKTTTDSSQNLERILPKYRKRDENCLELNN